MTWTLEAQGDGTLVAFRAEDVPVGIRAKDHVAAMAASLEQLARFVEPQA